MTDPWRPCDKCGENIVDPALRREGEDFVICDTCRESMSNRRFLVTLLIEVTEDEDDPVRWNWDALMENRVLVVSQADLYDRRITFLDED